MLKDAGEFGVAVFADNKYDFYHWTDSADTTGFGAWVGLILALDGYGFNDIRVEVDMIGCVSVYFTPETQRFPDILAFNDTYIIHNSGLDFKVMEEYEFKKMADGVEYI